MSGAEHIWYRPNRFAWLLWPLSAVFCVAATARRAAYRSEMLVSQRLSVPVIVVGNITVGGTGKTPLAIWICNYLRRRGLRPGILTRGYGGKAGQWPRRVSSDSDPAQVGDEPVVLARRTHCPVMAGPDRVTAGRRLLEGADCDILVSDDGLQHYALRRDIEIAVIDGRRRFGNGFCLPAGPLRERPARLRSVDLVVANGDAGAGEFSMRLLLGSAVKLRDPLTVRPLESFRGRPLLAVAGIGNPARFFDALRGRGLEVVARTYPDHHAFSADDFGATVGRPVLMTEKDAVKCESFAGDDFWFVPAAADPAPGFVSRLERLLETLAVGVSHNERA